MPGFLRSIIGRDRLRNALLQSHNTRVRGRLIESSRPILMRRINSHTRGSSGLGMDVIVVGSTIAACTGVYLYVQYEKQNHIVKKDRHGIDRRDFTRIRAINENLIMSRRNIDEGRWWVFITHTFTHFEWWHIGINMAALWSIGRPVVNLFGPATFAAVWVGAGVGGSLLDYYWPSIMTHAVRNRLISKPYGLHPDARSVGASGSICGMLGLLFAWRPSLGPLAFAAFSIYCIQSNTLPTFGHVEHLGGMGIGAALYPFAVMILRRRMMTR